MPVTDVAINAAIPTDGTQPSRSLTQALFKAIRGAELVVANPNSPYAWDIGANPVIRITGLTHVLTISVTGGTNGQDASLTVQQDATGNRVVTFGTGFRAGGTWTAAGNTEATFEYRWSNGALNPAGGGSSGSGGGSGGGHTIMDEGTALANQRTLLDFQGAGVTASDDSAAGKTVITIPGAGTAGNARLTTGTSAGTAFTRAVAEPVEALLSTGLAVPASAFGIFPSSGQDETTRILNAVTDLANEGPNTDFGRKRSLVFANGEYWVNNLVDPTSVAIVGSQGTVFRYNGTAGAGTFIWKIQIAGTDSRITYGKFFGVKFTGTHPTTGAMPESAVTTYTDATTGTSLDWGTFARDVHITRIGLYGFRLNGATNGYLENIRGDAIGASLFRFENVPTRENLVTIVRGTCTWNAPAALNLALWATQGYIAAGSVGGALAYWGRAVVEVMHQTGAGGAGLYSLRDFNVEWHLAADPAGHGVALDRNVTTNTNRQHRIALENISGFTDDTHYAVGFTGSDGVQPVVYANNVRLDGNFFPVRDFTRTVTFGSNFSQSWTWWKGGRAFSQHTGPMLGTAANRPAAGSWLDGLAYLATDTGVLSVCNGAAWITVTGGASGPSFYQTVQNAGSAVTQRATLNFSGTAVASIADDSANNRTNVVLNAGATSSDTFGAITPESKGAQGNGTTDDATAFNAAILDAVNTGKLLRGDPGKVYRIATSLNAFKGTLRISDCTFLAPNQVQVLWSNPDLAAWQLSGTVNGALTTATIQGTTVTRVPLSATTGLAVGDWVSVGSSTVLWPGETDVRWFETAQIVAVNTSPISVDLHKRLLGEEGGALSANRVIFKVPNYRLEADRLRFVAADTNPATTGQTNRKFAIELRGGVGHRLTDCHADSWWERFIRLSSCVSSKITRPSWDFLPDIPASNEAFGYGIHEAGACYGNLTTGIRGGRCRHGYSSGGVAVSTYDGTTPWSYGVVVNSAVKASLITGASGDCYDTHAGTAGMTFDGCTSEDPVNQPAGLTLPSGFQNRGFRTRILNCTSRGGDTGFRDSSATTGWFSTLGRNTCEYSNIHASEYDQDGFFAEGAPTATSTTLVIDGLKCANGVHGIHIDSSSRFDGTLLVRGLVTNDITGNGILDDSGNASIEVTDWVGRYVDSNATANPVKINAWTANSYWVFDRVTFFRASSSSPAGFVEVTVVATVPIRVGNVSWDLGDMPELAPSSIAGASLNISRRARITKGTPGAVLGFDAAGHEGEYTFTGSVNVDDDNRVVSIGGAPAPNFSSVSTSPHTLTDAERADADRGKVIQTTGAIDLLVPAATAPWSWQVQRLPGDTGAVRIIGESSSVSVNGIVGPTNPGATLAPGSFATIVITCRGLVGGVNYVVVEGDVGESDLDDTRVFGYRNRKYGALSGAQTLSAANFEAGSKLVNTGAAATYTLPSRLASTDTAATEELKVRNGGSGAITWSASGVTLLGDTAALAVGATAVLEWEHTGVTQTVEIRAAG